MTTRLNTRLQERASHIIEQLIFFHDHALTIILILTAAVLYIIPTLTRNKYTRRFILEGQLIGTT
jgi:cytochrome c oxidase subunit 2